MIRRPEPANLKELLETLFFGILVSEFTGRKIPSGQ